MKHEALTHAIIGCAMKVHSTLGNARLTGRASRNLFTNVRWLLKWKNGIVVFKRNGDAHSAPAHLIFSP
jgi:predicted transcriptional regulator